MDTPTRTSIHSLPPQSGRPSPVYQTGRTMRGRLTMTYSYTQIAQYLRCPRSYRHRYLDGWREKDSRPALLFGRCFEHALAAFFGREDSAAVLFEEWSKHQDAQLEYSHGDSWERMFRQGVQLLERLAQDDRIQVRHPQQDMQ